MKKIKALFVFENLGLGGVQTKLIDILTLLSGKKYSSRVDSALLLRSLADKEGFSLKNLLPQSLIKRNSLFFVPPFLWRIGLTHFCYQIYKLLYFKPDVVIAYLFMPSIKILLIQKLLFWVDFKVFVSLDNYFSLENPKRMHRLLGMTLLPSANKIIVQTQAAKKDLIKTTNIVSSKVVVHQNWIGFLYSKMQSSYSDDYRKKSISVIYCGRFSPQKRMHYVLSAYKRLIEHKISKLLMLGDGPQYELLEKYSKIHFSQKDVQLLKTVENPERYLKKSKIIILTSLYEGHPMVLLEAMYYQVVPVVIAFPGVDEYIKDGHNGYVVKTFDEMIKVIEQLLGNPSQLHRIAKNARRYVLAHNSESIMLKQLSALDIL
jgi:glycosyltransferase involved in cell wall biosynthesis